MEMHRFDENRHSVRDFIDMCKNHIGANYAQIDDSFGRGMIESNSRREPYGLYSKDFELWVGECLKDSKSYLERQQKILDSFKGKLK